MALSTISWTRVQDGNTMVNGNSGDPNLNSSMESRPSLLAAVHDVLAVPPTPDEHRAPHPFSTSYSPTLTRLNTTLSTTTQLSHALSQLSAVPSSDQTSKLVSLMKQHTAISTSIALSRAAATSLSAKRRVVVFPDTAPPSPTRLEEWGRTVGMEAFIDSSGTSPVTTIMMAGKVLVLDVDIDGGVVVKTSFAVGNNSANAPSAAPDLDAFLARDIARWIDAANRASLAAAHHTQAEDPAIEAAYLGLVVQDHLRYLMMLDSLAVAEGERGIRWFMEPVSAAQHFLEAHKFTGYVTSLFWLSFVDAGWRIGQNISLSIKCSLEIPYLCCILTRRPCLSLSGFLLYHTFASSGLHQLRSPKQATSVLSLTFLSRI